MMDIETLSNRALILALNVYLSYYSLEKYTPEQILDAIERQDFRLLYDAEVDVIKEFHNETYGVIGQMIRDLRDTLVGFSLEVLQEAQKDL